MSLQMIETTITVLPDGSIHIPPRADLPPGEHRAVLAFEVPASDRERLRTVLQAAGRLAELSPQEKQRAAQSTLTLDEARAILDRTSGQPLSEIILEMRGPKA
jgi:hypothetical protein